MLFSTEPMMPGSQDQGDALRRDDVLRASPTTDAGKIRLGGGFRPAAQTRDAGKIRLGGGFRRSGLG